MAEFDVDPSSQHLVTRLLNRDGSFNISRAGIHRNVGVDVYHTLLTLKWRTFMLMVVVVYIGVNSLFALGYLAGGPGALEGIRPGSATERFLEAFFFSVQTLATIGYGKITPVGIWPNILVSFEALIGLTGFAIVTGLLFARFSRPTAKVTFSDKALIAVHEKVPSLIFRIANNRMNQIVEAQLRVVLSRTEKTAEGETYRTFYDLELERSITPIFVLTWTIIHPITEKSPLYGLSHQDLLDAGVEIIASLNGIDETYAQNIHARFSYTPAELVWDKNFADMLSRNADGKIEVNLKRIHDFD